MTFCMGHDFSILYIIRISWNIHELRDWWRFALNMGFFFSCFTCVHYPLIVEDYGFIGPASMIWPAQKAFVRVLPLLRYPNHDLFIEDGSSVKLTSAVRNYLKRK